MKCSLVLAHLTCLLMITLNFSYNEEVIHGDMLAHITLSVTVDKQLG